MSLSVGYEAVLRTAKERFQSLKLEDKVPDGMVVGWPFRFISTGMIYHDYAQLDENGKALSKQRGAPITEEGLKDAYNIFHKYGYNIPINIEHNSGSPRGIVLDLFEAIDAEGNPCLACIPAYGPELAQHVKDCGGVLLSSPGIEWAPDNVHATDRRTGEPIGKMRIFEIGICVHSGQAPRILDTVRLTQSKDSVIVHGDNKTETIPDSNCDLFSSEFTIDTVIDKIFTSGDQNGSDSPTIQQMGEYIMDPEVQKYIEEQMAVLRGMLEEVMARLAKLEGEEPAEEESTDEASDEEAPAEEEMSEDKKKIEELQAELAKMKAEKLSREADEAISELGLRKCHVEAAKKAYIAEKLGKGGDLGFKPFTDIIKKMAVTPHKGNSGHSSPVQFNSLDDVVEHFVTKDKMSARDAYKKAIREYPALAGLNN